ncbi:FecR family protein [Fodinibius roseus]|uniref:FecR family protein n=1 Tax=Fodinibius roseus TaxID=1194090 RepID=A0A1M4V4E1_9BACT|nr:FecR domain-containing protein [Fodinibius roseus]SHE63844.1 FecR family protein [Fodinibius roseus]
MTRDPGDILLKRYLQGSCTRTEELQIERWLEEDPSHAVRLEQFSARNAPALPVDEERIKAEVLQRIGNETAGKTDKSPAFNTHNTKKYSRREFIVRWGAAAAVILFILSTSLGIYLIQGPGPIQEPVYVERTLPAGKTATYTLSDGSKVHLNSESTLKFPEQFGSGAREIYLDGEAFFEVTSDKDRPFEVHAGNLKTTVLGTAFNVKAFPENQQTQVAVEHGKVSVKKKDSARTSMVLTPNQWVTFDKKKKELKRESGDIRRIVAWKDGILFFHNKTVAEAANMLERWYGTNIVVENEAIKSCVLQGEHKEESLENVLEAMQFALNMDYRFTEKGVVITGGQCK